MSTAIREKQGGIGLNSMVLVSLLFHMLLLTLLFFAPSFPTSKRTFGPVYNVALVSFPGAVLEKRGESVGVKELMKTNRTGEVLKKSLAPAPIVPIRSLETRKKQDADPKRDHDMEKVMEEIRKRAALPGASRQPQAKTAPEPPAASALPGAAASQPGDAAGNDKMQIYYSVIWSRIKAKWALPQGMLHGDGLEAVIHVTILRSGGTTAINFEKRSGNRYFDESALKAIQKALPFPPLPAEIGGGSLEVGIRFHSTDLLS